MLQQILSVSGLTLLILQEEKLNFPSQEPSFDDD